MTYYRRQENLLESLLRWRRNVFLQTSGGYVLVSATRAFLVQHHFDGSLRGDPARTERLDQFPAGLFDGNGWNLALLQQLIQPERTIMPDNQPYAALYCKPLRASIRNLSDLELRLFVTLATYADDQGICYPGVRELAEVSGLPPTDVSEGLRGLQSKGFIYYLRHNQVDPITRKIMPNVYGLTTQILHLNSDSGIQTYMHEFLSQVLPSNHAQPDSKKNLQEVTPRTNASNQHHQPPPRTPENDLGMVGAGAPGRDYANQSGDSRSDAPKDNAGQPGTATPAAQPPNSAQRNQNASPGSAPPPPDVGALAGYVEPLADADLEALANELHSGLSGLQIAKARQLVQCYEVEHIRTALALYSRQPFGSVENPAGWFITKLRQRALVPAVDGGQRKGKYDDFLHS